MRGSEKINNARIRCYDNGGETYDRYTVIYMDDSRLANGVRLYECVGMSAQPFHPQGYGMHGEAMVGSHIGKRVAFASLPEDCRKLVLRDLGDAS